MPGNNNISPSNFSFDDIVDIKQQSLYARLKRLFSTNVIVRNVGGKKIKIKDTDEIMYATDRNSLRDRFNRVRSTAYNAYTRDFALSYQAARLDLFRDYDTMDLDPILSSALDVYSDECIGQGTIIPLLDGSKPTIEDLAIKYKDNPQERFEVFSYDKETNSIKIGKGYNPRSKGIQKTYKVVFDDNTHIIATGDHLFLCRNGEYKQLKDLLINESLMPFYEKRTKQYWTLYQPSKNSYIPVKRLYNSCVICGNMLARKSTKCCSRECYGKYRSLYYRGDKLKQYKGNDKIISTCLYCNKEFANPNKQKYCCKKCSDNDRTNLAKGPTILAINICKTCGKEYDIIPNNKDSIFCSNPCRLKWFSTTFNKENHYAYIPSEYRNEHRDVYARIAWTTLKNKIREDCDYRCQDCGKKESELKQKLSVHHLLSPRLFETPLLANDENNLICLCRSCHAKAPDHSILLNLKNYPLEKIKDIDAKKSINTYAEASKLMYSERFIENVGDELLEEYNKAIKNHKIKSIEYNGEVEVFDLSVDQYHNFATDSVFVHNCTTENEFGEMITIDAKDNNIKEILHNLFYDILNIEFNLWSWIRNMTKYGDFYLKLHISPEYGVYLVEPITAYNVERVEGSDPLNKNRVVYQIRPVDTAQAETLDNSRMAHFRLLSDSNFLPYGKSMLEGARRVWKQLSLMEDAMLIHRIMRAPERRIYKVDIGGIPPNEVDNYMEQLMRQMKKVPYMDDRTGDYNLRFNLQSMLDDVWLPVRGSDSGTSIDTLPGMDFTGIDDLEYIRNKMMAALKIPKPFLAYDESTSGRATLSAEDVRFARTIQRIQKMVISELNKIAQIHLYAQGYRDASIVQFTLGLTNPSTIFEKEKMEIWASKLDNAKTMWEMGDGSGPFFARNFIYEKIFKMSSDDIQKNEQTIIEDCKQLYRMKKITEEGVDPAHPQVKIDPTAEQGDGGGEEGGGDLGKMGGGGGGKEPDLGGGEKPPGGNIPPKGGGNAEIKPVKEEIIVNEGHGEHAEDYERPSQAGEKDSSKYPFGEDPLGDMENKRRGSTDLEIEPVIKKENFDNNLTTKLGDYITDIDNNNSIITENINTNGNKSLMDEKNIIE